MFKGRHDTALFRVYKNLTFFIFYDIIIIENKERGKFMKKTIYIYMSEDCNEPFVYTTEKEAIEAVEEEINYHAEKWGDDDESIIDAQQDFKESIEGGLEVDRWYGTSILDNVFGFHVREIEFND